MFAAQPVTASSGIKKMFVNRNVYDGNVHTIL